jgi:serine/threonine protein kinase
MPLPSGTNLGPYQIEGLLGAGGMGEVYRAHDGRVGRDVAVKIVPPAVAADATAPRGLSAKRAPSRCSRTRTSWRSTSSAPATG